MPHHGAVVLLIVISRLLAATSLMAAPDDIVITEYATADPDSRDCTQILFHDDQEIITAGHRLYLRDKSLTAFRVAPLTGLNDAHAVAFSPQNRLFYVADSGNHRVVALPDLSRGETAGIAGQLAGVTLDRPHDVVCDAESGWVYVLNPNRAAVFRCRGLQQESTALDLSAELGYTRALSLVQGKLYVIGSSAGRIVEIDRFESGQFRVHQSFGKRRDAPAGSWSTTGLVPNDADFYDGYWYATSYFCPHYAAGTDCNEHKLIRFRTWADFENGRWEDLGPRLPADLVPYYLTPRPDGLYLAAFYHQSTGAPGKVYRLTTARK